MNMKHLVILGSAASVALVLGSATPSRAAVIYYDSEADAYGYAYASWNGTASASTEYSDSDYEDVSFPTYTYASSYSPYTITSQEYSGPPHPGQPVADATATATVSGDAQLYLASPGQGVLSLHSKDSVSTGTAAGSDAYAEAYDYGDVVYDFDVTSSTNFTLKEGAWYNGNYYYDYGYGDYYELYSYNTGTIADGYLYGYNGKQTYTLAPGEYELYLENYYYADYAYVSGPGMSEDPYNHAFVSFTTSAVPEPSSWLLMGLGFAGLGLAGYSRKNAKGGAVVAA
jgi:hypothetical protein